MEPEIHCFNGNNQLPPKRVMIFLAFGMSENLLGLTPSFLSEGPYPRVWTSVYLSHTGLGEIIKAIPSPPLPCPLPFLLPTLGHLL